MTVLDAAPGLALAAGVAWPLLARHLRHGRARAVLARSRAVGRPPAIPTPRAPAPFRH